MPLHDITTGSLSGSGSFTLNPPSGEIWKVYGYWSDVDIYINGTLINLRYPDIDVGNETTSHETRAIYLDENDSLELVGQTSGTLNGYADVTAQTVADSTTSVPIETYWTTGTVSAGGNENISIPSGTWKVFTRYYAGTYGVNFRMSSDLGNESWTDLRFHTSNKPLYFTGGDTINVSNRDHDNSNNYHLGLLRIE